MELAPEIDFFYERDASVIESETLVPLEPLELALVVSCWLLHLLRASDDATAIFSSPLARSVFGSDVADFQQLAFAKANGVLAA